MFNENLAAFPTFITERLILRQLLERDVEEIFSLRSDATINKYLDRPPSKSLDDALSFIKQINEHLKNNPALRYWAIALKENEKLVGTICLYNISVELKKCEIGYELLQEYQGEGIMNEAASKIIDYAFSILKLEEIDALTHQDNQNSTKVLQKLHFENTKIMDESNPNLIIFRRFKNSPESL